MLLVNQLIGFSAVGGERERQIANPPSTGSSIGTATNGGGLSAAFDGTNQHTVLNCAYATGSQNEGSRWCGWDFGSGNTRKISKIQMWSSSDQGFSYNAGGNTVNISLAYSDNGTSWTQVASDNFTEENAVNTGMKELIYTTPTSHRYWRTSIWTPTATTGNYSAWGELIFFELA